MRSGKAVQDWISFNNEVKTGEPEGTKEPPEYTSYNNGEAVEDHNTDISRHSVPKNCRGNYILSNETLQQIDPYYTPPENCLAAANTQAMYQAHLLAQMNQTGKPGMALPSITNQGTADIHAPSVHAPWASSSPIQQPVPPQKFTPKINQTNASHLQAMAPETSSLPKNNLASVCAPDNKLILFPETQTLLFLLFRNHLIQPPH